MLRLVAEEGEGCAHGYDIYRIMGDLIVEGKYAKWVDNSGRYLVNWDRALECYVDYKWKKNPDFNITDQSRRTLSNGLRSALLSNSYKDDGAKEYSKSRILNDDGEVVERQFQMPRKVFKFLFGNAELSDSSDQQDEQERRRHLSKGAVEAQASAESSSDTGFEESMDLPFEPSEPIDLASAGSFPTNPSLYDSANFESEGPGTPFLDYCAFESQMFHQVAVESALEEICSDPEEISSLMGEVHDICPSSGPVKGGYPFNISLTEPLPDDVASGMAEFEGVKMVPLSKINPYTFSGFVPVSTQPRLVGVNVTSQSGGCLGRTCFHYVDDMEEMARQLVHDHAKTAKFFAILSQLHSVVGTDSDTAQGDSSIQAKQKQAVKFLELLVYAASQTGAKQFIEMIFSTSAQHIVFDSYKDRTPLPEDVARANGHCNLAQYLQDITMRLTKEVDDQPKAIDWLELVKAVQNQVSVNQDKESKEETTPVESDGTLSDYFADDETSSCGSFEHDDEFTSNPEGKDAAEREVHDICPSSGSDKGGYPFNISLTEPLPDDVASGMAEFEGVKMVPLSKINLETFFLGFVPGGTPSKCTKCRGVSRYESKEEKRVLMTENVVVSASTCRLKRPGYLVLSPLKPGERQLNQEQVIFEKSIGDESVHSPSTLLPSSVLNKSRPQPDNSASLHGLSSGNVSWKKESKIKEVKMARVRSWLSCNPNSEEFPSAEEETSSEATKCRGVYESEEEKRALMTENVVSASTCRLKRPGCLVLSPLEADERQLNQEQVIFEKSISDESVHSPSTLLPSCSVLNNAPPQTDSSASLHSIASSSWKNESSIKELKMERVRSLLSCNPNSEEFPSAEGFET